jgi:hypothetical protein
MSAAASDMSVQLLCCEDKWKMKKLILVVVARESCKWTMHVRLMELGGSRGDAGTESGNDLKLHMLQELADTFMYLQD